jgi:hypothetical protein
MATLRFFLTSFSASEPFTDYSVNVVASNGVGFSSVPCEPATVQEIAAKKGQLAQPMWDQTTVAAVCADKLGVPVTAGPVT